MAEKLKEPTTTTTQHDDWKTKSWEDENPKDIESGDVSGPENGQSELKRELKARHLSMIALGGSLGTGLLIGT